MKQLLLLTVALTTWFAGSAQLTGVVIEEYDPTIASPYYQAPEGLTTYRVYAEFANPLDKVSGMFGIASFANGVYQGPCQTLKFETTTSWYNEVTYGNNRGSQINCGMFNLLPVLAADSWLSIGAQCSTDPGAGQTYGAFVLPEDISSAFHTQNGSSISIEDGMIYTLFTSPSGFGTGPNNRVLLAQLSTTGEISYEINLQVFLNNSQANDVRYLANATCPSDFGVDIDGSMLGLIYPAPLPGPGCTDPEAINYSPSATEDDGSCQYVVISGCTDPTAINFLPSADLEDGSCIYPIDCSGLATVEITTTGGLFAEEIYWQIIDENNNVVVSGGAIDGTAFQQACLADGCHIVEMMDGFGDGWNGGSISITLDDLVIFTSNGPETDYTSAGMGVNAEGCPNVQEPPAGCTDPTADNYNPLAITDNGSCIYNNGCLFLNAVEIAIEPGSSPEELIWIILNPNGTVATSGVGVAGGYSELICLSDGCYTALLYDSFGDGWNGGAITISLNGNVVATSNGPAEEFDFILFGLNADCSEEEALILGCTDPAANNYNSQANADDGSCTYDGLYEGPMAALEEQGPDVYYYPNPTGGDVTVDIFGANGAEALIVTVNDLMGRIVFQRNYGNDQERLRINIESSAYASGVYLLTVQNGAHVTTRHIVKQ